MLLYIYQADHSPDIVKFPDSSVTFHSTPAHFTLIMPVLLLLSRVGIGMQQCVIQNQNEMHKLSKVKNGCKYAANYEQF